MWNNGRADMPAIFPESQDISEVNGITIDLTESQDHKMDVLEAIPNFMALLNSFSSSKNVPQTSTTTDPTNERTSRAKKK